MKIVFLEPLGIPMKRLIEVIENRIDAEENQIVYYDNRAEDAETLIERSKDAEVVILSNFKFGKNIIEECTKLKMICVAFTGVDHVDIAYCRERGIKVCNCAGYSTVAVADLVFGFVIGLTRNMIACDHAVRDQKTKDGLVGYELEGKKFGVIGLGAIGSRVAKIADAFGCEVYGYNRSPKNLKNVKQVSLDELLEKCDIVSVHLPLNNETRGFLNRERLGKMKPSAILINTARGPVVDNEALAQLLNEEKVAAAGVDVFDMEPPIPDDYPLLHCKNIMLTPHVAFASQQAFEKRAVIVADNIKGFLEGNICNQVV